jgi:hypothetical protein
MSLFVLSLSSSKPVDICDSGGARVLWSLEEDDGDLVVADTGSDNGSSVGEKASTVVAFGRFVIVATDRNNDIAADDNFMMVSLDDVYPDTVLCCLSLLQDLMQGP